MRVLLVAYVSVIKHEWANQVTTAGIGQFNSVYWKQAWLVVCNDMNT